MELVEVKSLAAVRCRHKEGKETPRRSAEEAGQTLYRQPKQLLRFCGSCSASAETRRSRPLRQAWWSWGRIVFKISSWRSGTKSAKRLKRRLSSVSPVAGTASARVWPTVWTLKLALCPGCPSTASLKAVGQTTVAYRGDVALKDGEDWTVTCKARASRLVAFCYEMGPGYEQSTLEATPKP